MNRITITIDRTTGRGTVVQESDTQTITVFVQALDLDINGETVKIEMMPSAVPAPRTDPK